MAPALLVAWWAARREPQSAALQGRVATLCMKDRWPARLSVRGRLAGWCVAGLSIVGATGTALAYEDMVQDLVDRRLEDGGKGMMLSRENNGQTVSLRAGELLLVRLDESPSTGFRWALSRLDDRLALVSEVFAPGVSRAPGAGGSRNWTFVARQPGLAALELKRWREWEGDRSVVERFSVSVRVAVD